MLISSRPLRSIFRALGFSNLKHSILPTFEHPEGSSQEAEVCKHLAASRGETPPGSACLIRRALAKRTQYVVRVSSFARNRSLPSKYQSPSHISPPYFRLRQLLLGASQQISREHDKVGEFARL
jgi:hypothetical protein